MADGSGQFILPLSEELIVDLFAGGGGMSEAIEQAFGRHADIAVNHNEDALSMHRANHPQTRHFIADVYEVDPRGATRGQPVGHLHLSPDCTHFSQAKGGQHRNAKIRGLSWVAVRWVGQVGPRVLSLENVRQILGWCGLVAKRDPATGRVVTLDEIKCPRTGKKIYRVADKGEQVPRHNQFLVPDPKRIGKTWRRFVSILESYGYVVEWRILNAADFGAPTSRERLFMVARRDGLPIVWPEPTHFKKPTRGQRKWRSAAECVDWSIPCPSIFERPRPLADATLRRIAHGLKRYVIDAAEPFIVPIANYGSGLRVNSANDPLTTITASPKGGSHALVVPTLVQTGYGERAGQSPRALDIHQPLGVAVSGGVKHALVTAFLAQHNTMPNGRVHAGHDFRDPFSTITNTGSHQSVITASLAALSQAETEGALRVAAFLINYYGNGQALSLSDPADTITTRDRIALVTVWVSGNPLVIVDLGLRMFVPPELYLAQGFRSDYNITRGHDGRVFTKSAQVRMVGNSVSPPPAAALLRANHQPYQFLRAA